MSDVTRQPVFLGTVPRCSQSRLLIYTIRRMAAGGLNDAFAANAMFSLLGTQSRRPLLLLRALLAEMARASKHQIMLAPCCCNRTTFAEAELLLIIASATDRPRFAHARLARMLGVENCLGVLSSAQALAQAFEDMGRPIELQDSAETEPAFPID